MHRGVPDFAGAGAQEGFPQGMGAKRAQRHAGQAKDSSPEEKGAGVHEFDREKGAEVENQIFELV